MSNPHAIISKKIFRIIYEIIEFIENCSDSLFINFFFAKKKPAERSEI